MRGGQTEEVSRVAHVGLLGREGTGPEVHASRPTSVMPPLWRVWQWGDVNGLLSGNGRSDASRCLISQSPPHQRSVSLVRWTIAAFGSLCQRQNNFEIKSNDGSFPSYITHEPGVSGGFR